MSPHLETFSGRLVEGTEHFAGEKHGKAYYAHWLLESKPELYREVASPGEEVCAVPNPVGVISALSSQPRGI